MSNQISSIINIGIPVLTLVIGWLLSLIQQKWGQKQTRKNALLKDRLKVYGEGLGYIYDVEQNQTNAEELQRIQKKWRKWHPSNSVYLPPSVNDALFGAMNGFGARIHHGVDIGIGV